MRTTDDKAMEDALEQINEGMFDRMKAKSAGRQAVRAVGGKTGVGGLVQKGKQGIIKGLGGQLTRQAQDQAGKENIAQSSAQVNTLTAQYMQQIQQIASAYKTDIGKLNIDVSMIDDKAAKEIVKLIMAYVPPTGE